MYSVRGENQKNFMVDSLSVNSKFESFFSKVGVDFIYIASNIIN